MKNIIDNQKNNQQVKLVALLVIFSSMNLFPMRMSEMGKAMATKYFVKQRAAIDLESKQKKRELLIFLDDSEKDKLGAIGGKFLTALYQEAGPIIVSTSLFCTLLEAGKKDMRSTTDLVNECFTEYKESSYFQQMESRTKEGLRINVNDNKSAVLASRAGFQPEQWHVKKINNLLNLLIPRSYLKLINVSSDRVQECCELIDSTSELELKLGLKVNHMESITIEHINRPNEVKFEEYFIDSLDSIFCKRSDYKGKSINIPEWFGYMDAHGLLNYVIAGVSFDGFKKLLNFFESKMNTKLFVVQSCYAAGANANKVYGEIKLGTQQQYSFPIIVQGLNDMSTLSYDPTVILNVMDWDRYSKVGLKTSVDFVSFFKKAKELEGNYSEIIKPISEGLIRNIPQIKLPGIEWFSVIEGDKKIVSIGSMLAKTRNSQQPLNVISFFKKEPEVILLYTDDIPFELVINSNKLKALVSMMSSEGMEDTLEYFTIHKIKEISSTQSFFEILHWFTSVAFSHNSKIFLIDKVKSMDSGWFLTKNSEYKDILIFGTIASDTHAAGVKFYWKDNNNVLFTAEMGEEALTFEPSSNVELLNTLGTWAAQRIEPKIVENNSKDEKDYKEKMEAIFLKYSYDQKKEKQGITPEQIKKIKSALIKKERMRQLQEAQK